MDPLSYINWIKPWESGRKVSLKLCKLGHFLNGSYKNNEACRRWLKMICYTFLEVTVKLYCIYSTVQKKWDQTSSKFGEQIANFPVSDENSAKFPRIYCSSPAKFRKLGDEPKRSKLAQRTEISFRNFEKASRNFASLTKFRFVLNDISVWRTEISCERDRKFRYWSYWSF